jgi:DNA replication protein DnaC
MACAFGIAACKNFLRVKYARLPDLLNDIIVARNTGTYKKITGLDESVIMELRAESDKK